MAKKITAKERQLRARLKTIRAREKKLASQERKIKKEIQREHIRERDKRKIAKYKREAKTLRKQRISNKAQEDLKEKTKYETPKKRLMRYSIAYVIGGSYNKSFRVEVYTPNAINEKIVINELNNFLHRKIQQGNVGLKKLFAKSSFQGIENESIGSNDLAGHKLNTMYFYFEDFI